MAKEEKNVKDASVGEIGNGKLLGVVDGVLKQIETDKSGGLMTFDKGVSKSDINVENGVTGFNPVGEVKQGDKRAVSGEEVYNTFKPILLKGNLINKKDIQGGVYAKRIGGADVVFNKGSNWISVKCDISSEDKVFLQGYQDNLKSSSNPIFIFADINENYISEVSGSDWGGKYITKPKDAFYCYIRLANILGIGDNPTNNIYAKSSMLSYGESERPYIEYKEMYINEDLIYSKYPNMIVHLKPLNKQYNKVLLREDVAYIYQRLYGDIYSKSILKYERLDFGDPIEIGGFVGGELVRLAGIEKVRLNLDNMQFTKIDNLVIPLESEFVLSQAEWIGGYHGNEKMSKVYFLINGMAYNQNGNMIFEEIITSCNSFSYVMASELVSNSDKSTLALRAKKNDFKNGGYEVNSRLQWKKSVNINIYSGISCISKYFTELTTNSAKLLKPLGNGGYLVDNDYISRGVTYYSDDIECYVKNNIEQNAQDDNSYLRIWDRATDTKFYRFTNTFQTKIDGIFETTTKVIFVKNN